MKCNTINQILSKTERSAGKPDHQNLRGVHLKTTKELVQEAYDLGKRHGRREMLCESSKATRNT